MISEYDSCVDSASSTATAAVYALAADREASGTPGALTHPGFLLYEAGPELCSALEAAGDEGRCGRGLARCYRNGDVEQVLSCIKYCWN